MVVVPDEVNADFQPMKRRIVQRGDLHRKALAWGRRRRCLGAAAEVAERLRRHAELLPQRLLGRCGADAHGSRPEIRRRAECSFRPDRRRPGDSGLIKSQPSELEAEFSKGP